jgi:hypothetical protein
MIERLLVRGRRNARRSPRGLVLVRGRPNPLQAAGRDGGRKLMEIKRLREKGVRITLLSEARFWKLVGPNTTRTRKRS